MENIGVINGFDIETKVSEGSERDDKVVDLKVIYMINGKVFTESNYEKVPEDVVPKVKDKLFDNTLYNLNVKRQCEAIALPTLVFQVEDIIYYRK